MRDPLRIFIVDDSLVARRVLRRALESDGAAVVVGEAANGKAALEVIPASGAELVLMDVVMPVMDGVAATRALMAATPIPIVLISDLVGRQAARNFEMLAAGALDLIGKPTLTELEDRATRERLLRRLRALAQVPLVTRRHSKPASPPVVQTPERPLPPPSVGQGSRLRLLAVGASTGGPPALASLLSGLAGRLPWPVVITQHITAGFTRGLAEWLAAYSALDVGLAEPGSALKPGSVRLAPDGRHLIVRARTLLLGDSPPRFGHRPSVDVMFESIVEAGLAPYTLAVLLTGMGQDGAAGLLRLRDAGAWTIAQDEASSVVYGMPKVAADLGAACEVLSLAGISRRLQQLAAEATLALQVAGKL